MLSILGSLLGYSSISAYQVDLSQYSTRKFVQFKLPKDYWNDSHIHDGFDYSTTEEIFINNLKTFGLFMKV